MSDELLRRTRSERQRHLAAEGERIARLVRDGQAPEVMYIGCSDSRVQAESLLGARPGDVFVVRTVANIVPPYGSPETSVAAAVEFGVNVLKVRQLLVCGHTDCGGIHALSQGSATQDSASPLAGWLRHAESICSIRETAGDDPRDPHHVLVEANVRLQLERLREHPSVAAAVSAGSLALHGWVFDLLLQKIWWYDAKAETFRLEDG